MTMTPPTQLTDIALTSELTRLAGREREATAALIVHLAEFDARRLYRGAGFPSLFQYCRTVLRLSEAAAYNRIEAARAARQHPMIVDMLVAGALSPTTVRLVARHLTAENHRELLGAASGKGTEEVKELLAQWSPQPDVAARVRALPTVPPVTAPSLSISCEGMGSSEGPQVAADAGSTQAPGGAASRRAPVGAAAIRDPIHGQRRDTGTLAAGSGSARARGSQRRRCAGHRPRADRARRGARAAEVLGYAAPSAQRWPIRRFAEHPGRGAARSGGSRWRPLRLRRDERTPLRRTALLEFHHVVPYGAGGKATVENIQLRCRAHNGYEAERFYGPGVRRTRVTRSGTSIATNTATSTAKGGAAIPGLSP